MAALDRFHCIHTTADSHSYVHIRYVLAHLTHNGEVSLEA